MVADHEPGSASFGFEMSRYQESQAPRSRARGLRVALSRLLLGFWAIVAVLVVGGVVVLALLGPPAPPMSKVEHVAVQTALQQAATPAPAPAVQAAPVPVAAPPPAPPPAAVLADGGAIGLPPVSPTVPAPPAEPLPPGAIRPPDPLLLEASQLYPGGKLPRLGPDRRSSVQTYAAAFNSGDPRPRVAVLVSGIGMNESDSLAAVALLPSAVSLAVSPYAPRPDHVLEEARARGHEMLVSIPMEPQGYPLNDPGNHALLTGATLATNAQRLEWVLTRFAGYVGATGALGDLRGERFAAATDQMAPVLDTLADRGLLYVDPRPNITRLAGSPTQRGILRTADLVLDDPPGRTDIDAKLARLEVIARDRGSALGVIGRPSAVAIDRITAWAASLDRHGVALAPVSAVVQTPVTATAVSVRTNLLR